MWYEGFCYSYMMELTHLCSMSRFVWFNMYHLQLGVFYGYKDIFSFSVLNNFCSTLQESFIFLLHLICIVHDISSQPRSCLIQSWTKLEKIPSHWKTSLLNMSYLICILVIFYAQLLSASNLFERMHISRMYKFLNDLLKKI